MSDDAAQGSFLRVRCGTCGRSDNWTRCEQCGRQSLFTLRDAGFDCTCGASYGHAVCSCGASVEPGALEVVPFDEGPLSWSEVQLDPRKLAALAAVLVALCVGGAWWILG